MRFIKPTPEGITIAITVHSRREYILDAVNSALNQTIPVNVIVVEDCGPDLRLQEFVLSTFRGQIEYFRNPLNRGLFDNWNACVEYCRTPWLSILHDDDLLRPNFVETMLQLANKVPERALYFGRSLLLTNGGKLQGASHVLWSHGWRDLDPVAFADECLVAFPGQLFSVAEARGIGGFQINSYFAGDWDMWFRLALHFGGVQSATEVSISRAHGGFERGSNRVDRAGWKWMLDNVQRKRNISRLRKEKSIYIAFNRTKFLDISPIPSLSLLNHARRYSKRALNYNTYLFLQSTAPHWPYAFMQMLVRLFGPLSVKFLSIIWTSFK